MNESRMADTNGNIVTSKIQITAGARSSHPTIGLLFTVGSFDAAENMQLGGFSTSPQVFEYPALLAVGHDLFYLSLSPLRSLLWRHLSDRNLLSDLCEYP